MHCPFCSHEETKVIDSRLAGEGLQVRRRRECQSCGERYTTFESAELVIPNVVKRDGRREPFDELKLRAGITRALEKRPVESEIVEESIGRIIHRLQTFGEREVTGRFVGDLVMEGVWGEPDEEEAAAWYTLAAEQGHAEAKQKLDALRAD